MRAQFLPPEQWYPEFGQCVHKIVSHPSNPKRLFLQNHWGLYRSDDGGDSWQEWNPAMRDLLIDLQATEGHESGSWAPPGGHDFSGGRIYATSLALLTLEVYYRHKRVY